MGIDNVADEIIREAEKRAKAVTAEGEDIKKQILEETWKKIKTGKEKIDSEMDRTLESIRTRDIMKAKMAVKESVLNEKKNLIDGCFEGVEIKGDVLQRLFEAGRKTVEPAVIYVRHDDMEKAKRLFNVTVKEKNIKGGLVLESKDGKESVDLSLERLVEITRTKSLKGVSKILFGD